MESNTDSIPPNHRTAALSALRQYARARDALLARIVQALNGDSRVVAAWLSGSFGRGEADEWSDYDLHVAIEDVYLQAFLDERSQLYASVGDPILIQADMASDSMPGGRYQLVLFAGSYQVDWNIGPQSQAVYPVARHVLIERIEMPVVAPPPLSPAERRSKADSWLTFFWAMASIAIKYAGRTETRRAVSQIELLVRAYIALWRITSDPVGPDPWLTNTNRILESDLDDRLPRVGEQIDAQQTLKVIQALCTEVEQLHPALAALGIAIPTRLPEELQRLSALATQVIQIGDQPKRVYR